LIVFFNTTDIASAGVGRVQRSLSWVTMQNELFKSAGFVTDFGQNLQK
jgi:hypothetical protein